MSLPNVWQFGYRHTHLNAPTVVAYTGTAGRTAVLAKGVYMVACSSAAHVIQGDSNVTATTSHMPVAASEWVGPFEVTGASDGYFSAIQQSAGGSLYALKVSE